MAEGPMGKNPECKTSLGFHKFLGHLNIWMFLALSFESDFGRNVLTGVSRLLQNLRRVFEEVDESVQEPTYHIL